MCGIAGIVEISGKAVEPSDIAHLTGLLAHRGPGGYQPMLSADGRYAITFNGQIYNFLELRRELEAQGAVFRTQSDTEVILAAWQAWREGMLARFNGMWALAIF